MRCCAYKDSKPDSQMPKVLGSSLMRRTSLLAVVILLVLVLVAASTSTSRMQLAINQIWLQVARDGRFR